MASAPEHGAAAAHIADRIREAIISGEYAPGTRIRQEELATEAGASRVPVREALRMLAAEGLVTLVANTGAWVSSLSLSECQEIYRVRERVEPLLLRMSAPNLDDAELDRLDGLAAAMAATDDPELFLTLDREFHLSTYGGAETVVLSDLVHRLWNRTHSYRRVYTGLMDDRARETVHDEHRLMVAAMRDRDLDSAESLLTSHIRRTRRQLAGHPELFLATPR
ncbi:GntR family transcriptional regulator [Agromyces tardus]|jgi:DNA-binding GntR family transcriptional regulator|uniref:GntR family transcriptional regulator n=1 Tax=Agromyces tardus TaxID=2583849 RepID=A0A3M8A395_9MICO|nr:GntR family transcriptional regulator [Agromyces tardus]RNB45693.1 GntR family transcriptional regulator [Agromyces tardus]